MKTFETEKYNIPEGATHTYDHGGSKCGYYKLVDGNWFYWDWCKAWYAVIDNQLFYDAIPIPQTNIETPEEKEALDLIDTTPHQYEMSKFSGSVFNNGDLCVSKEYFGDDVLTFIGMAEGLSFDNDCVVLRNGSAVPIRACVLSKPESQQQREERERLEAAKDLYTIYMSKWKFAQDWDALDDTNKSAFLAIVDKTNYRKEG